MFPYSYAQERHEAWSLLESIRPVLDNVLIRSSINDDMPVPELTPEPMYTIGSTNTIYWNNDEIIASLTQYNNQNNKKYQIVFYEVTATYGNIELWGFIDKSDNHAVFTELPNDSILFSLRYYAYDDLIDDYSISPWSQKVFSIQDSHSPSLDLASTHIVSLEMNGGHWWTVGNEITIHVTASDVPPGKLKSFHITETDRENTWTLVDSTFTPSSSIEKDFPYTLQSNERQAIDMIFYMTDWSGQVSNELYLTLYWWPPEDGKDRVICFPNPFNPTDGEHSTIKADIENVTEAQIFDSFGNLVRTLEKNPANFFFIWDGLNGRGEMVSKGGYLCVLKDHEKYYCKIAVIR